MGVQISAGIRFGGFLLDRSAGGLFRVDERGNPVAVSLGSRALDVLCILAARQGALVSKQAIMDAVWPDTAVEENNLTVQISALRRVLDEGAIQTVPGRGYRFVVPVRHDDEDQLVAEPDAPSAEHSPTAPPPMRWRRGVPWAVGLAGVCLLVVALLILARSHNFWLAGPTDRPRLSIVVLPFENLSGDPKDDYLAEGITDDLTSDLSHVPSAFVIARGSAYAYKGKPQDVRKIGEELGVRYVLEGSVRRIGATLRVNVQLVSGETGAHLWSDRFDEPATELAEGQEQIVTRMRSELGISMMEVEKARGLRERPTNPDAFDLILRARSLLYQLPTRQRQDEALALFEHAILLDPQSAYALASTAFLLIERSGYPSWSHANEMERAERLLTRARSIAPGSEVVLNNVAMWLRNADRYQEAMAVAEEMVRRFPNYPPAYDRLTESKIVTGHAEEAIPLQAKAIQLDPRSPWVFFRYKRMGTASLWLGRDADAINFLERSLAINPDHDDHQWTYRFLAAAYARAGRLAEAKHALAEADRRFPYDTVRSHWPDNPSSTVFAEEVRQFQEGLRLAGERDHAEEDADFGVPEDAALHGRFADPTPTTAPGVRTIFTAALAKFLAGSQSVVIDTVSYSWGRSIPGAIGLSHCGAGGSFSDAMQGRLRDKMRALTSGDLTRPIVAVGWNSERFDGRNLALRLVALGYTQVYWYRGGREAWEVNGLPETELSVQQW